ncbi:prolyl endopeptidase-like [Sitodiplosis mosellana]|uniref:prolyl endopeptidase-like n=1 Tax=Sitodiplosis mosellana TaxID=263140 RepID=UPI00244453D1|nr:prolyl endopeptidase-like [Sitodiplosis mosellana]
MYLWRLDFEQDSFNEYSIYIKNEAYRIDSFLAAKIDTSQNVRGITYPNAQRDESVVDDLHGTKVADPYRWLEDPYSEETKQFIDAQNELSQSLESNANWKKINEKLTKMWNYHKFGVPFRKGKYYFSFKNSGLQNQNVLYRQKSLTDELTELLDPNSLSADGTTALQSTSYSHDGSILAYSLSDSGSDWARIKFRNIESGKDYPDLLERVKFSSLAWTHDNKGLFYNRFDKKGNGSENDSNQNQKLYYHQLGDSQEKDVLVAEFLENPRWIIGAEVSSCGTYLILSPGSGANNALYFADLSKNGPITGKIPLTTIVTEPNAAYEYVANTGSKAVFQTTWNAPTYRLVVIDFDNYAEENWSTLIEENPTDVLRWAHVVDKDKLVVSYMHDVKSTLQVHSLETGKLIRHFPLEIGTIMGFSGNEKSSEVFYQLQSFLSPGTIYRYDFSEPNAEPTVLYETKLNLEGFDKNDFKMEQVFYSSRDGTKIPMYIVQRKDSSKEPRPCLLYGYGGFNVSLLPSFSVSYLFFMYVLNGILAIPNLRGDGEYGKKWHDGGRLLNKQNVFDDFQAAAEYLVQQKYTTKNKIAIRGGSNGGLLVGACINQRPDLFGAAVPQVGVMDMLRFHKFTIGHAWIPEYGNPDEKIDFENIFKYSPLHNVHAPNSTENQYPPTLITTADHDDRVSPLHSLKFAAALQYAVKDNQFQKNPISLRVYSKAGHGAGKPTAKKIEEECDVYTFLCQALQIDTSSL